MNNPYYITDKVYERLQIDRNSYRIWNSKCFYQMNFDKLKLIISDQYKQLCIFWIKVSAGIIDISSFHQHLTSLRTVVD